jgi:hypothetical protein
MYELFYSKEAGIVQAIKRIADNAFIPLAPDNSDFQQFLEWNAEQDPPLDLDSTIPVPVNYSISPEGIIIAADGAEEAVFEITAEPDIESIEVLVAGQSGVVPLLQGQGKLRVTSDVPGLIEVTGKNGALANKKAKVYAGVMM